MRLQRSRCLPTWARARADVEEMFQEEADPSRNQIDEQFTGSPVLRLRAILLFPETPCASFLLCHNDR
jgi:hypothetical protein